MSTRRFQELYAQGAAPWDIGRPQPQVVAAVDAGELRGRVLDVGCGTGENALFCAGLASEVVGVDAVPLAIERAREKARVRGVSNVRFVVGDALDLQASVESVPFDAAIDCGCFHVFDDEERARYVSSLARVLRPGARLHLLCFSDLEPNWGGPRRVRRDELYAAFDKPFAVESIERTQLAGAMQEPLSHAWYARIVLVEPTRAK